MSGFPLKESLRVSKNYPKKDKIKKLHKKPSPAGEGGSLSETDEA